MSIFQNMACIRCPVLKITTKGALNSQPQVIKVYQLLAHGRWFSPGTPVSSTTKTGRHDIAEILLKVALNTINQSIFQCFNIELYVLYDIIQQFNPQLKVKVIALYVKFSWYSNSYINNMLYTGSKAYHNKLNKSILI